MSCALQRQAVELPTTLLVLLLSISLPSDELLIQVSMAELASLLLAVAGSIDITIRTSSELFRLIRQWNDAPAQIISLEREIQQARQVALQLKEFCASLNPETDSFLNAAVKDLARKTESYWVKLETILQSLRDSNGRPRKRKWIKMEHEVTSLLDKLRELRFAIFEVLGIYTASQAIQIQSVVASNHDIRTWIESTSRSLSNILSRMETERPPADRNSLKARSSEDKVLSDNPIPTAMEPSWATVRYLDGPSEKCKPYCPCRCHTGKQYSVFNVDPFSGILGSLSLLYCGWQLAGPRCSISQCSRARFKLFKVTYSTSRRPNSISVVASLKLTDGEPMISLNIGRIVNITDDADPRSILGITKANDLSGLKCLLERRPDAVLDVHFQNGISALHHAALQGDFVIINTLLAAGADPFLEENWGIPAVFECYQRILRGDGLPQEKDDLKKRLPLSTFFDEYNSSHLHRVVLGIRPLRLQTELSKTNYRDELNAQDDMGMTPLHWAAICKDVSAVTMLLHAGAHSNIPDNRGRTALYEACQSNSEECARKLIEFGADISARYKLGYGPLHAAAVGNATRGLLSLVLSAGADIEDSQNIWEVTPLRRAVGYNHASCCKHLLDLGADIDSVDERGETSLYEAVRVNAHACLQLLLSRGANYLHVSSAGRTLLHMTAMTADEQTLEILLAADLKGLDVHARDHESVTARQYFASRLGMSSKTMELFEALHDRLSQLNADVHDHLRLDSSDNDEFYDTLESVER